MTTAVTSAVSTSTAVVVATTIRTSFVVWPLAFAYSAPRKVHITESVRNFVEIENILKKGLPYDKNIIRSFFMKARKK